MEMGDIMQNQMDQDVLKSLGIDSSNQWIFYENGLQELHTFLLKNITDENILTEQEVLEFEEMQLAGVLLSAEKCGERLALLEDSYPGLAQYTEEDVEDLKADIQKLELEKQAYEALVQQMSGIKTQANIKRNTLEEQLTLLRLNDTQQVSEAQEKAKNLEKLQKENYCLGANLKACFANIQSPPLFMHQLELDQYFAKCDSFMQYFLLYLNENYKIQNFMEVSNYEAEAAEIAGSLKKLQQSLQHYMINYHKEQAKYAATNALISILESTQTQAISLADVRRETNQLLQLNDHPEVNNSAILDDLLIHVSQWAQQKVECVVYENNRLKLQRANKNYDNNKRLSKIVSSSLANAELLWIAMQLDLEKMRNRQYNDEQFNVEAQRCQQRVEIMKQKQLLDPHRRACEQVLQILANELCQNMGCRLRPELKSCLYEYEKLNRLIKNGLESMLDMKFYGAMRESLQELDKLECILKPLVYDSPLNRPLFENVCFLQPIFGAKMAGQENVKQLRELRVRFLEKFKERMAKDKLWRNRLMLWIWFLAYPERMLEAIDEVKKAGAKIPALTGVKALTGIKRL